MVGLLTLLFTAAAILLVLLTAMLAWEMRHPPRRSTAYALAKGLACDPGECLPPLKFEEWQFDRPKGVSLAVWDVSNPKSTIYNPQSLTVVFIHGWGHSRINTLTRIDPFRVFCDRMVLYDLRGHGESRGCASQLGDGEDDDLLALLEQLGDERFVLVGHSMGAVIALNAVAKATRTNPALAAHVAVIIAYGPYADFHTSLRGRLRVAGYPTFMLTRLAMLVQRLSGITPPAATPEVMAALCCPVLIVHGTEDEVSPIEHGRQLAAAGTPDAVLHEVPGAMHVDAHELDRAKHDDLVARILMQWLARPVESIYNSHHAER